MLETWGYDDERAALRLELSRYAAPTLPLSLSGAPVEVLLPAQRLTDR